MGFRVRVSLGFNNRQAGGIFPREISLISAYGKYTADNYLHYTAKKSICLRNHVLDNTGNILYKSR